MARQAEAERERRAKIINAEGEFQAAERLAEAAVVMALPIALQLRYLQTLLEIGSRRRTRRSSSRCRSTCSTPFLERAERDKEELSSAAPELRRDPLSGRLVVVAPDRARRPGAFPQTRAAADPDELDVCPFCAGPGDRTPPETLRLPAEGDWQVRVVPEPLPRVRAAGSGRPHARAHALDHRALQANS